MKEGIEAVVDGGEGDARHGLLYAGEDFIGSGVVSLREYRFVNHLALTGRTKTRFGELSVQFICGVRCLHDQFMVAF